MATAKISRPASTPPKRTTHKRMTILSQGGNPELTVPYAPREITHSDLAPGYTELDRAIGVPLLKRNPSKLRKMSFTLFFGHVNPNEEVSVGLNRLIKIARSGKKVKVRYGWLESVSLWRINDLSIHSIMRNRQGEITRAEVNVEFVAVTTKVEGPGPVNGGNKTTSSKADRPKYYVVKPGDTLSEIAVKFYGNDEKWRAIAKANGIKNPKKLKVGTRLRLP